MSNDPNKDRDQEEEVDEDYDPEAEVVGNWKLLDLPEVPVVTGEEQQQTVAKFRSKIYRWRKEWKERGVGELKFLKHKKTGFIRLLARAQKTHKCIINHFIQTKQIFCKLEQMKTSNNAWTWAAYDVSDQKAQTEKLCAKFTSKEDFDNFKVEFEKAAQQNARVFNQSKAKQSQEKKEQAKQAQPEKKD